MKKVEEPKLTLWEKYLKMLDKLPDGDYRHIALWLFVLLAIDAIFNFNLLLWVWRIAWAIYNGSGRDF